MGVSVIAKRPDDSCIATLRYFGKIATGKSESKLEEYYEKYSY